MKKKVIIFQGTKSPTQSGMYKTQFWYLKFDKRLSYEEDLITGWKGNVSPKSKTKLKFSSLDSAIVYAEKKNYEVIIAAAGGAAHLAGVTAALTTIPVLGVQILPFRSRSDSIILPFSSILLTRSKQAQGDLRGIQAIPMFASMVVNG